MTFSDLLLTCARLLDEAAQAQLNREVGARLARPSVMRLVPYLTATGIRPTVLAGLVDVSKQAVGQSLADLAAKGLVEYVPDPTDGRARLVRLTRAGVAASKHGNAVLANIEGLLAAQVGKKALRQTRRGLEAMQPVLEGLRTAKR